MDLTSAVIFGFLLTEPDIEVLYRTICLAFSLKCDFMVHFYGTNQNVNNICVSFLVNVSSFAMIEVLS